MAIQQHPDYHDGFFDALDGEPIWEHECTPEYAAGWRAYWAIHDELAKDDSAESFDEAGLPVFWPHATFH